MSIVRIHRWRDDHGELDVSIYIDGNTGRFKVTNHFEIQIDDINIIQNLSYLAREDNVDDDLNFNHYQSKGDIITIHPIDSPSVSIEMETELFLIILDQLIDMYETDKYGWLSIWSSQEIHFVPEI